MIQKKFSRGPKFYCTQPVVRGLNIKMPSYQYRDSHYKDRSSYLHNTIPIPEKTVFILRRGPVFDVRWWFRIGYLIWSTSYIRYGEILLFPSATWWRHKMEPFSALLAICAGNSPVSGEFPAQRPVTRSFDVFFDLCPNKRLSKQSWGWWFETPSGSLWRHSNENGIPRTPATKPRTLSMMELATCSQTSH